MKRLKAACFGPLSRTPVTKQDKQGTDKIASVFTQNYPASLKPFEPRHSWQTKSSSPRIKHSTAKMNTISSLRCVEHSGTVRSVNTREPSAILCWLRKGDQLGSRRNAKPLLGFLLLCLFHKLYPLNLSRNISCTPFLLSFPHSLFCTLEEGIYHFVLIPSSFSTLAPSVCAW